VSASSLWWRWTSVRSSTPCPVWASLSGGSIPGSFRLTPKECLCWQKYSRFQGTMFHRFILPSCNSYSVIIDIDNSSCNWSWTTVLGQLLSLAAARWSRFHSGWVLLRGLGTHTPPCASWVAVVQAFLLRLVRTPVMNTVHNGTFVLQMRSTLTY